MARQGWTGMRNGMLLSAAEADGWQVFLTVDVGVQHQNTLAGRRISVVTLRARSNDHGVLLPLMPRVMDVLASLPPGAVVNVSEAE